MCRIIIFTHDPSDRRLTFSNSDQASVCLEKIYYWLRGKWLMHQFICFVVNVKWLVSEGIFGWNKLVMHEVARSGLYGGCSNTSYCGYQRISTVLLTVCGLSVLCKSKTPSSSCPWYLLWIAAFSMLQMSQ